MSHLFAILAAMSGSMKDRLIKKFEDEITALDRELKLELPKEIKRARELGDLRENAEYSAAKERQRLVEARISMLKKRVGEIALINIERIPTDRAKRSEIGVTRVEEESKQQGGETIAPSLHQGKRAGLRLPEDPRADHQVGTILE